VEVLKSKGFIVILLIGVILGTAGFVLGLRAVLRIESPLMVVASESMVPTLHVGDVIVVQGGLTTSEIEAAPAPEGDIIVFREPGDPMHFIVHRAINETNGSFETKGDNNYIKDPWPVSENNIIGKVIGRIPLVGYLFLLLRTPLGLLAFIALILIFLFQEYLFPQKKENLTKTNQAFNKTNKDYPINLSKIKKGSLIILVSVTVLPYVASFIALDLPLLYSVKFLALMFWYGASLTVPLVFEDLSSSFLFWVYHLVLVGIPVGSALVYHITSIMPSMWYTMGEQVLPVAWHLPGALSHFYYSFISTLGLLLMPGCVLFVAICWVKYRSLLKKE